MLSDITCGPDVLELVLVVGSGIPGCWVEWGGRHCDKAVYDLVHEDKAELFSSVLKLLPLDVFE